MSTHQWPDPILRQRHNELGWLALSAPEGAVQIGVPGSTEWQIAECTGQSQSEVSEILKGRQVRAYDVLERIAEGLGIPADTCWRSVPLPSQLHAVHVAQVRDLTKSLREAIHAHGSQPQVSSAAAAWADQLLDIQAGEPAGLSMAHRAIADVAKLSSVRTRTRLNPLAAALETRSGSDYQDLARMARQVAATRV